jgi:cell division protein FtsI (penicillin-binding protein 3)
LTDRKRSDGQQPRNRGKPAAGRRTGSSERSTPRRRPTATEGSRTQAQGSGQSKVRRLPPPEQRTAKKAAAKKAPAKKATAKKAPVKKAPAKKTAAAKKAAVKKTVARKQPASSRRTATATTRHPAPPRKNRGTPTRRPAKRPTTRRRTPKRPPRTLRLGRPALRLRIAFFVMAFVLSLFAGRLVLLQGVDPDSYALAAAKENTRQYPLHASRGAIVDRDGIPLAVSEDAVAITADPKLTAPIAQPLAKLLAAKLPALTYDKIVTQLVQPSRFEYVARKVSPRVWDQIKDEMKAQRLVGLYTQPDPVRSHPNGDVAANVIGFVGAEGKGLGGLEYGLNEQLSGTDGKAIYEVDARGNRIPLANHTVAEPKPGVSAQLTIDRDLQWYAQQRIAQQVKLTKAESGSVVLIDTKTGELLVAATYPSFDPDKPAAAKKDDRGNRVLEQVYEPGSVQKVVTMAALADAGLINLNTRFTVPGALRVGGKTVHDHFDHGTLRLTASGVIAKSSNIGTIMAAQQMPVAQFVKYLYKFGFNAQTGIGFPGESRGIMPPGDEWSELTRSNVAFGQGLSANAVQMAAAVNAVANGGVYVPPKLVRNYLDASGNVVPVESQPSRRVVSAQAAKQVTTMMEAVTGDGGTAKTARIAGYRVAGKTGTAQETGPECGGRYCRWATSFAGFAPADNPRFVGYVVLQNPTNGRSGGGQGGPVFRDVMSYALQKYAVPPTGAEPPETKLTW